MEILVADFSMYQSRFIGVSGTPDEYDPAKWVVDIDFAAVAASDVFGVIIRVGIGLEKDPCFDRYRAGLKSIGKPWGIYHAYWPSISAITQAQLVSQWCPETPPLGMWGDLEAGDANYPDANQYLVV